MHISASRGDPMSIQVNKQEVQANKTGGKHQRCRFRVCEQAEFWSSRTQNRFSLQFYADVCSQNADFRAPRSVQPAVTAMKRSAPCCRHRSEGGRVGRLSIAIQMCKL
eukprot:95090-Amphidinium_carterae.1